MDDKCLTVDLVERIQLAIQRARPIEGVVESLRSVTLSGLIEYGCLRFAFPNQVPEIPERIRLSPLGKAAAAISSPIGIRNDGAAVAPIANLQASSAEFYAIGSENDLDSTEWNTYCYRFERAAKESGFAKNTAINLHSALHEMVSNAFDHAKTEIPALVGYATNGDTASFCVSDVGIGILESLRISEKHRDLTESTSAIRRALMPGVSRFSYGGSGFNSVFKAITQDWGVVRFRSGNGCISMDGTGLDYDCDTVKISFPPALPGFQVSVSCHLK